MFAPIVNVLEDGYVPQSIPTALTPSPAAVAFALTPISGSDPVYFVIVNAFCTLMNKRAEEIFTLFKKLLLKL